MSNQATEPPSTGAARVLGVSDPGMQARPTASLGRRLLARVLDVLLVGVAAYVLLGECRLVLDSMSISAGSRTTAWVIACVLVFLLVALYYVGLVGGRGATAGKAAMGIRVVDAVTGNAIGFGRALVRELVLVVTGAIVLTGFLSPLFDRSGRRRGWHDRAARTTVIAGDFVATKLGDHRTPRAEVGETLLDIRDATLRFGGLTALDSVSFQIKRGEILGLIGPNGAGKTTCFNAMTGVYRINSGQIIFDGTVLRRQRRFQITRLGIARTFQNIRLFGEMTALENVVVGLDARHKTSVPGAVARSPRHFDEERSAVDRAMALLTFVGIADRAADKARNLPYGYQRRLEIARALATEPKLLCLDEPAAGFNPAEKDELMQLIRDIRDEGYTVLLIEHDMRLVMGVTDRIVVLEFGHKIADGTPEQIRNDPAVVAAYLGVPDDGAA